MSDRVTVTIEDGVADVRLNRPDKLNAIDWAMFQALAEAGDSLHGDRSLRAVVLSGEGRSFCAGLDMSAMQALTSSKSGEVPGGGESGPPRGPITDRIPGKITNWGQQAVYTWTEMPVPVIAAVHGHALGGGFQIALGCDIRYIHPEASMSVMEARPEIT